MHLFVSRRFEKFSNMIGDKSISEFLGLSDKISIFVERDFTTNGDGVKVTFIYRTKTPKINFLLPDVINDHIHSYCGDFIVIKTRLECPKLFPYNPPVWKLLSVKNNLFNNGIITLEEYYRWLIGCVNRQNIENRGWTAIYGFEKEILRFFSRINHFESVIEGLS